MHSNLHFLNCSDPSSRWLYAWSVKQHTPFISATCIWLSLMQCLSGDHPISLEALNPWMTFQNTYSISKIIWRILHFSMSVFQFPSLWHLWVFIWQSGLRVVDGECSQGWYQVGRMGYHGRAGWESLDFSLQISPLLRLAFVVPSVVFIYLWISPLLVLCEIPRSCWGCPYSHWVSRNHCHCASISGH